jgi:hypothetical protein
MQFNLSSIKKHAATVAAAASTVLVSGLAAAQTAPAGPGPSKPFRAQ